MGTLSYMSPEQARGEPLDARSDLFSLGIVLYEMATRQVPFKGTTSALMFVQLFNHNPESIRNWNESIPRALEKVILKLLEKNPQKRFQTAKELQEALMKASGKVERVGWQRGAHRRWCRWCEQAIRWRGIVGTGGRRRRLRLPHRRVIRGFVLFGRRVLIAAVLA